MAKIILTKGDKILQEIVLVKERVTIGRRPHNDVVIEDIAISGEHAVIHTNFSEAVLEDLNSTNGVQVNGQPIKTHFLQNQDVVELAEYRLRYIAEIYGGEENSHAASAPMTQDIRLDLLLDSPYPNMRGAMVAPSVNSRSGCAIKLLNGACAGKQIDLTKPLTTLGQPGLQVAAIARIAQAYYLAHVEGTVYPLLNGHSIGANACNMAHGDVIDLVGARIKFLFY
ncbi:MAG: hypothetical protein A3I66_15290 [Burkholderiales bacterium RIFCSPLOWO2_02_FULL_57_36]|nr:MAG: hypothetical protein A3I66_15290 [Burkholderiales bacterium RIFCSPLOWO2_02_FULL_57_36]